MVLKTPLQVCPGFIVDTVFNILFLYLLSELVISDAFRRHMPSENQLDYLYTGVQVGRSA